MRSMNIKEYNNLPEVRYKNARVSLLIILFMSFINVFSIVFGDYYFVFSSYITSSIGVAGAVLYYESGKYAIFLVATVLVAVISLLPYLFCWIFSKKHYGWLIASLVLFSIDSALLLVDSIGLMASGSFYNILDIVIHAYVIVSLALGVAGALKNKNAVSGNNQVANETAICENLQNGENENLQNGENATAENSESVEDNLQNYDSVLRTITLNRKKAFYGCAVKLQCVVDGKQSVILKNGQTVQIEIDGNSHNLTIQGGLLVSKTIIIPSGSSNLTYDISFKMHAMESEICLEEKEEK